jgi:hypothetical protein
MNTGAQRLITELAELGYNARTPVAGHRDFVVIDYVVELGPLVGGVIEIGRKVPPDYPLSAPGGVLVRPHLLPINSNGGEHPHAGVHPGETGGINDPSFQYWSRPIPNWPATGRDAQALIAHVRSLFATLPAEMGLRDAA